MNILALDTALGACSVAVASGERVLVEEHQAMLRGHAEALAPMVQRAMVASGITFNALDRIGVTTGPGTFTGQRVGLAFARALGVALNIPVVGVTTLHAMAEEALSASHAYWAIIAADAKRGEVYLAAYARRGSVLRAPSLIAVSAVTAEAEQMIADSDVSPVLAGTAAPLVESILKADGYTPSDSGIRQPRSAFVARLALGSEDLTPPRPLYLRPPDARLPGSR